MISTAELWPVKKGIGEREEEFRAEVQAVLLDHELLQQEVMHHIKSGRK